MKINHIQESILSEAATAIFRELEQLVGERFYVHMRVDADSPNRIVSVTPISNVEPDYHKAIRVNCIVSMETIHHILKDEWFDHVKTAIEKTLSPEAVERYFEERRQRDKMADQIELRYGITNRDYANPMDYEFGLTGLGSISEYPFRF